MRVIHIGAAGHQRSLDHRPGTGQAPSFLPLLPSGVVRGIRGMVMRKYIEEGSPLDYLVPVFSLRSSKSIKMICPSIRKLLNGIPWFQVIS